MESIVINPGLLVLFFGVLFVGVGSWSSDESNDVGIRSLGSIMFMVGLFVLIGGIYLILNPSLIEDNEASDNNTEISFLIPTTSIGSVIEDGEESSVVLSGKYTIEELEEMYSNGLFESNVVNHEDGYIIEFTDKDGTTKVTISGE